MSEINWDYYRLSIPIAGSKEDSEINRRLSAFGKEGWELVSTSIQFTTTFYHFKRPHCESEEDED